MVSCYRTDSRSGFFQFRSLVCSDQLLSPSWRGVEKIFPFIGRKLQSTLAKVVKMQRDTHQFVFSEVKIPLGDGVDLPGWLIKAMENNLEPAQRRDCARSCRRQQ